MNTISFDCYSYYYCPRFLPRYYICSLVWCLSQALGFASALLVSSYEVAGCFKKGRGRCFRLVRSCLLLGLLELVLVRDSARSLGLTQFLRRLTSSFRCLTERLRGYGSLWPYAKRSACYASTGPGPYDIDPTADSSMGNEKLNGKHHVDEIEVLGEQNGEGATASEPQGATRMENSLLSSY